MQTEFGVQPRRYYSLWNRLTKGCVASGEWEYDEVPELKGGKVRVGAKNTWVDEKAMWRMENMGEGRWGFVDKKEGMLRENGKWLMEGLMVSVGEVEEGEEGSELAKCWEIVEYVIRILDEMNKALTFWGTGFRSILLCGRS